MNGFLAMLKNLPDAPGWLVAGVGTLAGIFFISLLLVTRRVRRLEEQLSDETFHRQSLSTRYGRISEQWFPLMDAYPYDPEGFRFLGSPLDGVQFEEDRIIFIEFKANKSRLSEKQKHLKQLIEEGHVYWDEFHFTDGG